MAGKGSEVGSNFSEIKRIIDGIDKKELIGVCMDTCHLNDAGYDISNFSSILDEIDSKIGLSYVKCIHINDSKNPFASHKDRHANIGFGTIGFDNLLRVIYDKRLESVPKIKQELARGNVRASAALKPAPGPAWALDPSRRTGLKTTTNNLRL